MPTQKHTPTSLNLILTDAADSFSSTARRIATSFAALSILSGSVAESAHTSDANTPISGQLHRVESPRAITNRLLERTVSCDLKGATIEQALSVLGTLSSMPIETAWNDNSNPNELSYQQQVSLSIENKSLRFALDQLASQMIDSSSGFTWQVLPDGRLQFGSKERLNSFKEARIYDISDLLIQHPQFLDAPRIDISAALQQGTPGTAGGSILTNPSGTERSTPRSPTDPEMLKNLLTSTIETDQWQENGGTGGSIRVFRNTLIIKAAPYMHRAIE
ncbi:MAG: hypothetical protein EBZ48_08710 [Proteobacteria bacterium]|nr:hypothetical protein [Pseudomonadota bacterium]